MGKRVGWVKDFPLPSIAMISTQPERMMIRASDFAHEGLVTIYFESPSSLRSISPVIQASFLCGVVRSPGRECRRWGWDHGLHGV